MVFFILQFSNYVYSGCTAIEQEESDTTLYGCIKDSVVVVSLMFFCSSFSDEQRFSILADKSEIALRMFSFCLQISMLMAL